MQLIQRYSQCFVCGDKNETGLRIDFFYDRGKAKAEFTPRKNFQGYKDLLHGGILSTLLDEVMIKAILAKGIVTVTSRIEVKFKKPASIGQKLFLEGKISEDKGRVILTEGKVLDQEGNLVASAEGKYFKVKGLRRESLMESFKARLK